MYCPNCGMSNAESSNFCVKCGTGIGETTSKTPSEVAPGKSAVKKPSLIWLYLVGVALVGTYAAALIPAFAGKEPPPQASYGYLLWTGLFMGLWWKRRARKGWHGALIGVTLGFIVAVGGEVIYRFASASALESNLLSSVEQFDPRAAEQIRSVKNDQSAILKVLQPVLARAVDRAPDEAVLALASTQVRIIAARSTDDPSSCAAAARGTGASVPRLGADDQATLLEAESGLFRAAARNKDVPVAPDEELVQRLLAPIYREVYAQIVPGGDLDDPAKLAELSDRDMCELYLNLNRRIHALPARDAASMIRYMIGASAE